MKTKDILIAVFVLALLGTLAYVWFSGSGVKKAPDVEFTLLDGKRLRLKELRGKPVLITFWATTCPACRREVPHLIELYEQFRPQGFEIVAVTMHYDPPAQVLEFKKQKQLPYLIALDLKKEAAKAFDNVNLTPTSFVIAKDGRIVFHKVGEFETPAMHTLIQKLLAEKSAT